MATTASPAAVTADDLGLTLLADAADANYDLLDDDEHDDDDDDGHWYKALTALLTHAPDLLDVRTMGRLSVTSKELGTTVEPYWKGLFARYARMGESYEQWSAPNSGGSAGFQSLLSWVRGGGEMGLPPCLSSPDSRILSRGRGGHKRAAGCLGSKSCARCGTMTAWANPLTMTRMCLRCADEDESSWIATKSKAKEAFLLGEVDLRSLPSVTFPTISAVAGKEVATTLYLLTDVKAASFGKYGGADGLADEFIRRTQHALDRYARSQSTSRPQKKRPRITKTKNHRPADNLAVLRSPPGVLPLGTIWTDHHSCSGNDTTMSRSYECSEPGCRAAGGPAGLLMHQRLQHGPSPLLTVVAQGGEPLEIKNERPMDLASNMALLAVTDELRAVFASSETTYCNVTKEGSGLVGLDNGDVSAFVPREDRSYFTMTVGTNGCKLAVDVERVGQYCTLGNFTVWYQTGSNGVPVEMLNLGIGEYSHHRVEAPAWRFDALARDGLGLRGGDEAAATTAGQFLAAAILHAMPLRAFVGDVLEMGTDDWDDFDLDATEIPVFAEAFSLLKAVFETAEK